MEPLFELRWTGDITKRQLEAFCSTRADHQEVQVELALLWARPPVMCDWVLVCELNSAIPSRKGDRLENRTLLAVRCR